MSKNGKIPKLDKPFRSRIVGHGEERVDQMLANPGNWRLHPTSQQDALAGGIDDIGFIRSVTINRVTGHVVDGHLRVTLAARSGVESLPVEYVELDKQEEAKALLLLDPIAAMAASDKDKLDELLHSVQSDDERVQAMLESLAIREGIIDPSIDYEKEWEGMPEFKQDNIFGAIKSITIHFASVDDIHNFSLLIGQTVTEKTKSIWYPKQEAKNLKELIAHES